MTSEGVNRIPGCAHHQWASLTGNLIRIQVSALKITPWRTLTFYRSSMIVQVFVKNSIKIGIYTIEIKVESLQRLKISMIMGWAQNTRISSVRHNALVQSMRLAILLYLVLNKRFLTRNMRRPRISHSRFLDSFVRKICLLSSSSGGGYENYLWTECERMLSEAQLGCRG